MTASPASDRHRRRCPILACTLWTLLALPLPADDAAPDSLWIHNAFLVDAEAYTTPTAASLRIAGERIAEIRPTPTPEAAARAAAEAAGPSLDAGGRFLVPGFIDTHAHLALGPVRMELEDGVPALRIDADPEVVRRSLLSLLAHGVTAVRDPGGDTERLVALRDRLRRGELDGPRMVVAGAVIDRQPFAGLSVAVTGSDEVRAEVRRQAAAGVDWIKLYTQLDRDELAAGIDEAHRLGLKTVAHLQRVSWTEAARLGLDALVHVVPGSEALLPEAAREAYRPDLLGTQFLFSWFAHVDFEAPQIKEMIATLLAEDVTLDLTLVAFEGMVRGDQPWRTRGLPELELAAPSLVESWRTFFTFNVGWPAADFERARRAWPRTLAFARLLHDSGVELTAGTDANNPWTVPGPSFHRELELMADAGIPAPDILRIATRNGARAIGLGEQLGSLAVGKLADLVLLARNPRDDISASRDIVWVMQGGRRYDPKALYAQVVAGPSAERGRRSGPRAPAADPVGSWRRRSGGATQEPHRDAEDQ